MPSIKLVLDQKLKYLKPSIELACVKMVQVTCSRWICSKDWDKLDASLGEEICEEWHIKANAIARVWNRFYLWSWL